MLPLVKAELHLRDHQSKCVILKKKKRHLSLVLAVDFQRSGECSTHCIGKQPSRGAGVPALPIPVDSVEVRGNLIAIKYNDS